VNAKDSFKKLWKRIVYEIKFPDSSDNHRVLDYLAAIRVIAGGKKTFSDPSEKRIAELLKICDRVREDDGLTDKERDALLQEIAWPEWFPVRRW